ncbi:TonB-dependent receptor [Ameyamaea chiangmaiensis]|uniref:TonB-dependent receptor n=2 Tax=Ameyamaea chiangmaiensis TaxID=442969 RepID=A0A850P5I3_9PROT|nr:TonB-dependent receptor [Ameyamaea chiangmaiensis]NVN39198.1 TonB-dependent receptor [Ameyamaea chiangmaiensis]
MTQASMEQFVAGTSPMKMLGQMPGINFVSDDPLGNDSWGSSLYLRGFSQSQIGMTLDGVPLGSQEYYTYNGQSSSFAIAPDNIAYMSVSEGAGAVDMPATTALGGGIQMFSSDPKEKAGAKISQMFGSNDSFRTFVRLDSGKLTPSGTRFYVSYARSDGMKWKGDGEQFGQMVNAKVLQPIGHSSKLSAFFTWNDATQFNYADQSLAMIHALGYHQDYYFPNYAKAYNAANGQFDSGLAGFDDAIDVSYYEGVTHVSDYLGGLNLDLALTDRLNWTSVVYGQSEHHYGTWTSPYTASPNGAPLSDQIIFAQNQRYGFTSALRYDIAHNSIEGGVWYENNHYTINEFQYAEPVLGEGAPIDPMSGNFGTPFQQNWGMGYNTNTFQFHLQDTYRPLPTLTLRAGFRSLLVTTAGGTTYNNIDYNGQAELPNGSLTSSAAALPHFNIEWRLLPHHEVYVDIAKNMRAYSYGGYQLGTAWGVSNQETFRQLQKTIKPETDWVYAIGYRYTTPRVVGSLNLYHADFSNRLQSLAAGTIIQPVTTVLNVGSVSMYGADISLTVRPFHGLSLTNSFSYNHSVYGNNINSQGTVYDLKGKYVVNYPQFMFKSNVTYQFHQAEVHFDANYISRRYFSYTNDTSVPGFWMTSLGARYRFGDHGVLHNLTFDFNIYNLINTSYISQMGENGNPMSGDYQSLLAGAPRQYFGTISAEF